jgi:hypothetical protein
MEEVETVMTVCIMFVGAQFLEAFRDIITMDRN